MKKGVRNSHISNRLLYTFITIGILLIIGAGVYATTYTASGAGHPYTEISTCGANQILKMNSAGTAWTCATDATGSSGISGCTLSQTYASGSVYLTAGTGVQYATATCPSGYTRTGCSGGVSSTGTITTSWIFPPTSPANGCEIDGDVSGLNTGNAYVYAYCSKTTCS